jgi:hypothetical protein
MPTICRWYIRTALLWLVAAMALGGLLLANIGLALSVRLAAFLPAFYHMLTIGWLTQLIFGVALWMFPARSRDRPRGDERVLWAAYGALNAGLLLRVVAEPSYTWQAATWSGAALVASAMLQAAAIWLLVFALWPRVRGRTAPPRHADRG